MRRRELLERCAAAGVLLGVTDVGRLARAWAAAARTPTATCELGPFYKRGVASATMLRAKGDIGLPLAIAGTIYDTRGDILRDAQLELWHADNAGHYDLDGDRFRTRLSLADGTYHVDTIVPGHYPDRVCQHVHVLVRAPGHRPLVTQMYLATDPVFEGNPAKNFGRDALISSVELVRPVTIAGDPDQPSAHVAFDLVLERA